MEASAEKCQQMIDVCKAASRLLAVGYRCRFEPHSDNSLYRKRVRA
jgi:predicted dehydrogenase